MMNFLRKEEFKCIKSKIMDNFRDIFKGKLMINVSLFWRNHFLFILMQATLKVRQKKVVFILMRLQGLNTRANGQMNSPQEWESRSVTKGHTRVII